MKEKRFPGGVWPVMLTPFTEENQVDYPALKELVEWYIENGVDGLFAVCQSSEMFKLTLEERVGIAAKVKEFAAGRVPVIASGHISDSLEEQIHELKLIAETGVDAVIMITNRMAAEDESDEVWISNTEKILEALPSDIRFGLYECPYPYKRVMSPKVTEWCASTGRFYFLKDTCCDADQIREKLAICKDTHLKLYNANTATLLESLKDGAYGYCGVMANMHPRLYRILYDRYQTEDMTELSEFLTMAATLVYIKSRSLLPKPPKENTEEEDPADALIRQLREYRAAKETGEKLRSLLDGARGIYAKLPEEFVLPPQEIILEES